MDSKIWPATANSATSLWVGRKRIALPRILIFMLGFRILRVFECERRPNIG